MPLAKLLPYPVLSQGKAEDPERKKSAEKIGEVSKVDALAGSMETAVNRRVAASTLEEGLGSQFDLSDEQKDENR